jgi:hypothetical protein
MLLLDEELIKLVFDVFLIMGKLRLYYILLLPPSIIIDGYVMIYDD